MSETIQQQVEKLSIGLQILFIISAITLVVWRAFVSATLWNWFMPLIGLPEIGIALAIGLATTVSFMLGISQLARRPDMKLGPEYVSSIFGPLFILGTGWLLTKLM